MLYNFTPMNQFIYNIIVLGIRPPINISRNEAAVAPGRHLSIVCESVGNYSGNVEWTKLNGAGEL